MAARKGGSKITSVSVVIVASSYPGATPETASRPPWSFHLYGRVKVVKENLLVIARRGGANEGSHRDISQMTTPSGAHREP